MYHLTFLPEILGALQCHQYHAIQGVQEVLLFPSLLVGLPGPAMKMMVMTLQFLVPFACLYYSLQFPILFATVSLGFHSTLAIFDYSFPVFLTISVPTYNLSFYLVSSLVERNICSLFVLHDSKFSFPVVIAMESIFSLHLVLPDMSLFASWSSFQWEYDTHHGANRTNGPRTSLCTLLPWWPLFALCAIQAWKATVSLDPW